MSLPPGPQPLAPKTKLPCSETRELHPSPPAPLPQGARGENPAFSSFQGAHFAANFPTTASDHRDFALFSWPKRTSEIHKKSKLLGQTKRPLRASDQLGGAQTRPTPPERSKNRRSASVRAVAATGDAAVTSVARAETRGGRQKQLPIVGFWPARQDDILGHFQTRV